jgi:hypothetical protein
MKEGLIGGTLSLASYAIALVGSLDLRRADRLLFGEFLDEPIVDQSIDPDVEHARIVK